MTNKELVWDYIWRASVRLKAIELLYREESWADVVRESQEVVELVIKATLRYIGEDVPRIHDVSGELLKHREKLPVAIREDVESVAEISRTLRRDRELAFYGAEDITPSGFYTRSDALKAKDDASYVVGLVTKSIQR